jgi:acyl-CoA thioester hydrolase
MSEFTETTLRVRYAETDQMGVVYHANYLVWFEVGRVELLRQIGIDYKTMESQDDTFIVVVEASCRYRKPARYDEIIKIRTRIGSATTRMCRVEYEVLNDASGELLATGATTHVFCDRNGKPRLLPAKYRAAFSIPEAVAQNAES